MQFLLRAFTVFLTEGLNSYASRQIHIHTKPNLCKIIKQKIESGQIHAPADIKSHLKWCFTARVLLFSLLTPGLLRLGVTP